MKYGKQSLPTALIEVKQFLVDFGCIEMVILRSYLDE
jgi:hypothetical protein